MSDTGRPCDLCARPSGDDAYACTTCTHRAATALRSVHDWLAEALEDAVGKRTALGGGKAGGKPTKASEAPLLIDLRAAEAAAVLRSTLSTWVRLVHAEVHVDITGPACRSCRHRTCGALRAARLPEDTLPAMATWLAPLIGRARRRPYGAELVDEITAAVTQATRAVDSPIRYVPLPGACRMTTLNGDTPMVCGGALVSVVAPGLPTHGQVRCEVSRDHTTTVEIEEKARKRAARVMRARLRTA